MNFHARRIDAQTHAVAEIPLAPLAQDPVAELIAERARMVAAVNGDTSDDLSDAAYEREAEIDRLLANTRATSTAGALAAAELLRQEIIVNCPDGDLGAGETLWLGLIASIEGVLRAGQAWEGLFADAERTRDFLFKVEPVAHDAKGYAEATRVLAESGEVATNMLVKVAYLSQDATEKLLDMMLEALRSRD